MASKPKPLSLAAIATVIAKIGADPTSM